MYLPCLIAIYIGAYWGEAVLFSVDRSLTIGGSSQEGSQEFSAGDTLELNCAAKFQIEWAWPNNTDYMGWSDPSLDGRLDVSPQSRDNQGRYTRRLRLMNLNHADTGKYYCYEAGNKEKALDHYVFVDDTNADHIFLHWVGSERPYSHLMAFYTNKESRIDCLVTHPDATVELFIGNINVLEMADKYDPRSGFLVPPHELAPPLYPTDKGAISSCVATLPDGRSDEVKFLLLGLKAASKIHIAFNDSTAQHSYRGGGLELDCTGSMDQSFALRCTWLFPAENEAPSNRIHQDVYQDSSQSQSVSLKIYPLRMSDEGNYTCVCDDRGAAMNSSSTWIHVSETEGQVTLVQQSQTSLEVETGTRVEFFVRFSVWPSRWRKTWWHRYLSPLYGYENRSLGGQDPRISVLSPSPDPFWSSLNDEDVIHTEKLIIDDTAASDSGEYLVNIDVADTTFIYKFNLSVKSSQLSSELLVTPSNDSRQAVDRRFLYLGNPYNVICLGTGYPLPRLELHWKSCVKNQRCPWATITAQGRLRDGTYQRALILRKSVTESGTYNCIAADESGGSLSPFSVQAEMIVTDIRNSELNQGMALDVKQIKRGKDGDPNAVYEKDGFSLECLVQKYDYSEISWFLQKLGSNGNAEDKFLGDDLSSMEGYNVTYNSDSPYSNRLSLTFAKVTPKDSGNYVCKANLNPSPIPRIIDRNLTVIGVRRPSFTRWTSSWFVKANYSAPFTLRCGATGSPTPKVEWWKQGKRYHGRPGITISPDNTRLEISRVVAEDAGKYNCRARNRDGFIQRNITLSVMGAPGRAVLSTTGIVILSVCLGLAAFIVLVLMAFVCILKRRERAKTALLQDLYDQLMSSAQDGDGDNLVPPKKLDPDKPLNRQADNLPYDRRFELSRNWLRLDKILGEGQFGRVWRGTLKIARGEGDGNQRYSRASDSGARSVAVKIPLNGRSLQHQKALLDELKVMIHIGKHVNVLELIGAVTKHMVKGELYVVVELCSLGSLLDYLRSHRATFVTEIVPRSPSSPPPRTSVANDGYLQPNHMLPEGQQQVTTYQSEFDSRWSEELNDNRLTRSFLSTSDLLSYSYQTANGMDFLASKNLIHRDLAARNLLLTDDQTVKIADFGLARQEQIYHITKSKNVPLPIKWMAVESITHQDFTVMSDVWSFGVVMWEFFSLGETPYPSQPLDPSFVTFLKEGHRLEQPNHCPDEIFHLMRQCWVTELRHRPTFTEAREALGIQLRRCSPQLHNRLISMSTAEDEIYEEPAAMPVYYNWNMPVPEESPASNAALKLNLPLANKRLQGFREVPQEDPDSPRLSSSVENESYMLQAMEPSLRHAHSYNTGPINTPPR